MQGVTQTSCYGKIACANINVGAAFPARLPAGQAGRAGCRDPGQHGSGLKAPPTMTTSANRSRAFIVLKFGCCRPACLKKSSTDLEKIHPG